MRGVISVFAGLLATSGAWAEPCRVAQTGTLNVHGEPNGPIVGTLNEGTIVYVVCDHRAASQMGEDCAATGKDRLGAPQLFAL